VGTAAAIALRENLSPRGVYEKHIKELQQTLLYDDAYIPWHTRAISPVAANAKLSGTGANPDALRNGTDRPVGDIDNGYRCALGGNATYDFGAEVNLSKLRLVFDSDLDRSDPSRPNGQKRLLNMRYYRGINDTPFVPPATLVKDFRIEAQDSAGNWNTVAEITNNWQRLVQMPITVQTRALRFVPLSTWGAEDAHVFAFEAQ